MCAGVALVGTANAFVEQAGYGAAILDAQGEAVENGVVGPEARGEGADGGSARIESFQMNFGDDDVGRTVGIEDHPPPGAAGAAGLGGVEKERIDAEAGRAAIVDGAAAGAEAGPGLLPPVLAFARAEGG